MSNIPGLDASVITIFDIESGTIVLSPGGGGGGENLKSSSNNSRMSVLDWRTAEPFIRELRLDKSSRLSRVPGDIVDYIRPYTHTWMSVFGIPMYDYQFHGTVPPMMFNGIRTNSSLYRDGKSRHPECIWCSDGGFKRYDDRECVQDGVCIMWNTDDTVTIYRIGNHTTYNKLPDRYWYVWELMTRTVDIPD